MKRLSKEIVVQNQPGSPYATDADFCKIFKNDMNRLYMLSYLLTANGAAAEQCFVGGLEESQKGNPVFKEWAESWARRTIISNAIRMVNPRAGRDESKNIEAPEIPIPEPLAGVLQLTAFERFVVVMTMLEGYSERECSLLLHSTAAEVTEARTRSLIQLTKTNIGHAEKSGAEKVKKLRDLAAAFGSAFAAPATA